MNDDLIGRTFGRLTILRKEVDPDVKVIRYVCQCSCPKHTIITVRKWDLIYGKTKSCGCYHRDRMKEVKLKDLTGQRFGRLTVIKLLPEKSNGGNSKFLCKCDCGNECVVQGGALTTGNTKSCGCYHRDRASEAAKESAIWTPYENQILSHMDSMKKRCYNPRSDQYMNYGGRGIVICDEWLNDRRSFVEWAKTHGFSPELTIERIDVNGNYCPENCRWATKQEQANNRRTTILIDSGGVIKSIADWARFSGEEYNHMLWLKNRYPDKFALTIAASQFYNGLINKQVENNND